jgi:hypothetical protein
VSLHGVKPSLRGVLPSLGLAAVSALLCLALLEAAARAAVHRRDSRVFTTRGSIVRFHPLLGWDKPPGAEGWLHREEYDVYLQVNPHGLRGPDRPYPKPPGTHRTLLLGDSFAEGYTVDERHTVRAVLESRLEGRGCGRHEVLNGGTMGYSTDQEYLFYASEGRRYQPDVVVVLFCSNDLYYNTTGEQGKPYFELDGGRLVLRNSPVPPPSAGPWVRSPEGRSLETRPWRGSMALRLLSDRTLQGNPRLHRLLARVGLVEPQRRQPVPPEMWPLFAGHREEVEEMWRRTESIFAALREEVQAGGGTLAVFYIPDRWEVDDRSWELTLQTYEGARRGARRDKVVSRLREACLRLGIPLVDPREALRAAEAEGQRTYFLQDYHWTAAGHRVAADQIAGLMDAQRLVGCPAAGTRSAQR